MSILILYIQDHSRTLEDFSIFIFRGGNPTFDGDDSKAFLHFQVDTEEAAEWADSIQWLLLQKHVQVNILLSTPEECVQRFDFQKQVFL